ncbi:RNA polymerase sigma factor [Sphingobacterium kyonggiense]
MRNYTNLDENELLEAIASDDLLAFNEFYSRYVDGLFQFVNQRIGDIAESEDIVQEMFVAIWSDRNKIKHIDSISSYLFKTALNKSLNTFRRDKIKEDYIQSFAIYLSKHHSYQEDLNPEEDQEQAINLALVKLPTKMRLIFELRYFKGLSNQEIADKLEISIHTVSTQMKRALKTIRKHIHILVFITVLNNL